MNKVSDLKIASKLNETNNSLCRYKFKLIEDYQNTFSIESINNLYKTSCQKELFNPNIRGDFFRDGKNYNHEVSDEHRTKIKDDISYLEKLKVSLRVTNYQLISSEIKEITTQLSKELNLSVTCNMYITPSSEANCFNYHIDEQYSLIAQLAGRKCWYFPLQNQNTFLKKLEMQTTSLIDDSLKNVYLVEPKDLFTIGPNLVHKAELFGDQMSVHLTFAILFNNAFNTTKYFFESIKNHLLEEQLHLKSIDSPLELENLKQLLIQSLESIECEKEYKTLSKAKLIDEIKILKKGRNYS